MHTGLPTLILCTMHQVNSAALSPSYDMQLVCRADATLPSVSHRAGRAASAQTKKSKGHPGPGRRLDHSLPIHKLIKGSLSPITRLTCKQVTTGQAALPAPTARRCPRAPALCPRHMQLSTRPGLSVVHDSGGHLNETAQYSRPHCHIARDGTVARPTAMSHTTEPIMQCTGHDTRS